MSEVYWITGAKGWEASQGIDVWLARNGLKPAWINEVFWLSQPGDPVISSLPSRASQWNLVGTAAHRLLQLILSDLLYGRNDLVLLVESLGQTVSLAALATPQAVGRFNLEAAGRLKALGRLHQGQPSHDAVNFLRSNLIEMEVEPESLGCFVITGGSNSNLDAVALPAKVVELPVGSGLIESVLALLDVLKNQPAKTGVLVDGEFSLATLLEVL